MRPRSDPSVSMQVTRGGRKEGTGVRTRHRTVFTFGRTTLESTLFNSVQTILYDTILDPRSRLSIERRSFIPDRCSRSSSAPPIPLKSPTECLQHRVSLKPNKQVMGPTFSTPTRSPTLRSLPVRHPLHRDAPLEPATRRFICRERLDGCVCVCGFGDDGREAGEGTEGSVESRSDTVTDVSWCRLGEKRELQVD